MKCDRCNGTGYVEHSHRNGVSDLMAWERGYLEPIKCKKCGGSGFVLGNYNEVIEKLDFYIKSNQKPTIRELKQLKDLLNK